MLFAVRGVLAGLSLLMLSGCTYLRYSGPNGERLSRCAVGATTSIASLVLESDTNAVRRIELRGYSNDSVQALSAVTDAAVRAAVQSLTNK